jgi:hypothetical protein
MRLRSLALLAPAVVAVPFLALPAAQAAETTPVTIVHLIPLAAAAEVDIAVDGELLLDDFAFEDIDGADVPPGTYLVEVYPAGWSEDDSLAPILSESFTVGTSPVTIAAQLTAAGAPDLVAYADDFSETAVGKARVTVRHAAAAPAVDIAVNGTPDVVSALANSSQASLETAAGEYSIETSISPDGPVVDDLSADGLELEAGIAYIVYAYSVPCEQANVSAAAPQCFGLFLDSVEVGEKTTPTSSPSPSTSRIPTAVPAGDGTAGWSGPLGVPALILIGVGALLALAVGMTVRASTSGSHR